VTSKIARKKLSLSRLEESAKAATNIALQMRPPIRRPEHLTLGKHWEGDTAVFELYIAKDRPEDAIVLTETRVNAFDGRVESVHVFDEALQAVAAEQSKS
jgi:hypothetical protein